MKTDPTWHSIHDKFTLNGSSYALGELREVGYALVKEGMDFEVAMGDFLLDWTSDRPTIETTTSGSTGPPKKITLKKIHMVRSAEATGRYFGLQAGDTALLCLPCSGIAGKMMLVRAMVLGLRLQCVEPTSTPLQNLRQRFAFCAMVPLQMENSMLDLSRIGTLIVGGAPVSFFLKERLMQLSTEVFETYGMTETMTHIAVKRLDGTTPSGFQVLPDIEISQDNRKCLVINAPKIADGPIITNDVVELMDESSFKWLGRYDSVVNSGGIKLQPEQIEEKLATAIPNRFFVAGTPDRALGQKLVLVIEGENVDTAGLLQKIGRENRLGRYEMPKKVIVLKKFVETVTGKVHREKTMQTLQ